MPIHLQLTPDELLSTTRAVRSRLDYARPVEREVILECAALAQQAPNASNEQLWHFVFVSEPAKKKALARLYKRGAIQYMAMRQGKQAAEPDEAALEAPTGNPLADHMHEMPYLLIPCIQGRTDHAPAIEQSAKWGTIVPATWSFMLAARSRGLGTCLTSLHLAYEKEAAEVLGIPYDQVQQTALIPVAYTKGTDFKAGKRKDLDEMLHWDGWVR